MGINYNFIIDSYFLGLNYFQGERDKENNIREIKINYLIEAYRKLANASARAASIASYHRDIESAISDIQLFGSKEEIEVLLQEIDNSSKDSGKYTSLNFDNTLTRIRNSLRKEIQLEPIDSNVRWYRFYESNIFDSSLRMLSEPKKTNAKQ